MSRIYYNGKFFDYPLKASNAFNLGILEALRCVFSYIYIRIFPIKEIIILKRGLHQDLDGLYNIF